MLTVISAPRLISASLLYHKHSFTATDVIFVLTEESASICLTNCEVYFIYLFIFWDIFKMSNLTQNRYKQTFYHLDFRCMEICSFSQLCYLIDCSFRYCIENHYGKYIFGEMRRRIWWWAIIKECNCCSKSRLSAFFWMFNAYDTSV